MEPPFLIKNIIVSELKDIKIIDVSANLYFGRRFQVMKVNKETENFFLSQPLKFSKIIKKVKKISENEGNLQSLKEIHQFLGTLKTVEDDAIFAFNKRNWFYRIITRIQRLFKSKSNLDEIKELKAAVDDKIKVIEPKAFEFEEKKDAIKLLPFSEQQSHYVSLVEECIDKGQLDHALEICPYIISGKIEKEMRNKIHQISKDV